MDRTHWQTQFCPECGQPRGGQIVLVIARLTGRHVWFHRACWRRYRRRVGEAEAQRAYALMESAA